jgi:GTP-binding protein EngB required for normal cell division
MDEKDLKLRNFELVSDALKAKLKEIILYTTVLAPMKKELFGNLCLIDTPGYNPPAAGSAEHDFETAREYIKDAEFLIWMVGLDANGTIPKSDLDFLGKLEFGHNNDRPLYIIANKAELKKATDIEDILDNFADSLDDNDIQYSGISAYSSKQKKLYAQRKCDIFQFLKEYNKPSKKYAELKKILHDVFKEYVGEVHRDHEEKETKRKEVKTLLLNALEGGSIGLDDASSKLEDGLNNLLRYFNSKEDLNKRLERVRNIRDKFLDCLNRFCDEAGIDRKETRFCVNCGKQMAAEALFCTECGRRLV